MLLAAQSFRAQVLMQFQKDGEIGFKHAIYLLSTKLFLRSLRLVRPASARQT